MTIVASVKVRDGVALATDSMTQVFDGDGQWATSYQNARKLFQVRELPVGVMSYGLGNIGDISVEGFVREFCEQLDPATTDVAAISQELYGFIRRAYDAQFANIPEDQQPPTIGFFVGGYGGGGPFADQWEFIIPRDAGAQAVWPNNYMGANWRGIDIPFTRLYKGLDPRLAPKLKAKGLTDEDIAELYQEVEAAVMYHGMPVQDAVNFAAYIVKTTIGMATYERGVPSCGGPIQMATILPADGLSWVERPDLTVQV